MLRSFLIVYLVCLFIKKVLVFDNSMCYNLDGDYKMKILNFGSCNIDYVYSLDHIVKIGETETTHKLEIFPGGKGLNQSIAVAKAGVKIFHAGCLGNDSEILTDILVQNGVDISYLKTVDAKNGHAIIQVSSKGENSIFLYPGSNEMISKEFVDSVLDNFDEGDIILLQNEINNVDYIVEKAYKRGMCVILNPSPFNERINKIDFNMLSYIVVNEVELSEISGCAEPEEGLVCLRKEYPWLKIILTLGENGSVFVNENQELHQAAFSIDAVDTTAAGDTFIGYFIAELSRGTDYPQILKIASAASAITVSREGAAPSIPSREELLASLYNLKENIVNSKENDISKQIDDYIEQNIKTANLVELSKILGYSTAYTGSMVKKVTGETFSNMLLSKRCKIAARMLLDTDLSIKQIIDAVGYENESFFRKAFKNKYGANLLEFRKKGAK